MSTERILIHKNDRQTTGHIVHMDEVRHKREAIFKISI
jgi:hypothetical protein